MSRLTVTEKEHWKSRIENRIKKSIQSLEASAPTLMPSIRAKADMEAHKHLGTLELHQTFEANRLKRSELEEVNSKLESEMFKQALGNDALRRGDYFARSEFSDVHGKHRDRIENELLKDSAIGQEILKLRTEKEALLDTVWLATSNAQIRDLWNRVSLVLGDEATELQQSILEQKDSSANEE